MPRPGRRWNICDIGGPYEIVAGDLSGIGMRGLVFAPFTGPRRPAVVLGHGYLQPVSRYAGTLRFLASSGFAPPLPPPSAASCRRTAGWRWTCPGRWTGWPTPSCTTAGSRSTPSGSP